MANPTTLMPTNERDASLRDAYWIALASECGI